MIALTFFANFTAGKDEKYFRMGFFSKNSQEMTNFLKKYNFPSFCEPLDYKFTVSKLRGLYYLKGLSLGLQNHVNFSVILHTSSFIVSNNLTVDCYQPKGILIHSA